MRTPWRSHVRIEYQNGLADITWEKMLEWLHDDVTDDATRSLEAVCYLSLKHISVLVLSSSFSLV